VHALYAKKISHYNQPTSKMNTLNKSLKIVVLTLLITPQVFSSLFGAELPHAVRTLVEKRQDAISRIDNVFVQELEKIKVNYTKAGDLESANMVAELIKKTKEGDRGFSVDGNDSAMSLERKLVGKWLIYDTDNPKVWSGVITISEDLAYSVDGKFGAAGYQKGNVVLKKENNKIIIGPYEFNVANISTGKIFTRNAGMRTMERVK